MSGVECGVIGCRLVRFGGRLVGGVVADGDAPEVLVAVTDRERDGGEFDRSAVERACPGPSCGGLLRLDPADVADREAPPLGVCFASMFVRQVRQCFSAVWADGFPRCRHRFPVM